MSGMALAAVAGMLMSQNLTPAPPAAGGHRDVRCGGLCLYVALEALGLAPKAYAELERRLGPAEPKGYSVAQLAEAAKALGAHALAVETTIENLKARAKRERYACIVLMSDAHFLTLYDLDDAAAHVVDPPREYAIPIATFRPFWTGTALLIGREPLASEESLARGAWWPAAAAGAGGVALACLVLGLVRARGGRRAAAAAGMGVGLAALAGCGAAGPTATATATPRPPALRLEPEAHELGDVPVGRPDDYRDVTTFLVNEGGAELRITSVESNCSCTALGLEADRVPPGGRVRLASRVKLGNTAEPRRVALRIATNDPARPVAAPTFTWRAVPPVRTEPAAVDWPAVAPGAHPAQELAVHYRPAGRPGPFRVECTSYATAVEATFEAAEGSAGGDGAEVRLGTLRVRLREALDAGDFAQPLALKVFAGEEEAARLDVPVSWRVRPEVELIPNRLALGRARPGEVIARTVGLRSASGRAFRVASIRADDAALALEAAPAAEAAPAQAVTLRVTVPDAGGPWRTIVRLRTDHEGATDLELPVSALVEAGAEGGR
jgi:hypothetical protein